MGINVDCGILIDFMLQEILNALKKRQGAPFRMDVGENVGENEEKILELIRKDKWISAKNLAGHVGLSARQVEPNDKCIIFVKLKNKHMETEKFFSKEIRAHHGHNLRAFREQKNIQIEELAKMVKISREDIEKLEETQRIDDETLLKMADALEVSVEAIKSLKNEQVMTINQTNTYTNENNTNSTIEGNPGVNNDRGSQTFTKTLPSPVQIAEAYSLMLKMEHEHTEKLEARIKELEEKLKEKENPSPSV